MSAWARANPDRDYDEYVDRYLCWAEDVGCEEPPQDMLFVDSEPLYWTEEGPVG